MSGPRVTRLDNGFRIISENWQRLETVSVGVWVDVGSRHEPVELGGIAHYIEHMLFKGTKKRSAQAIAEEIEAVGGHLNAYTSRDQTTYFARVLKDDLDLAVDMISDILLHSNFDPAETAREQDVILQEIGQSEDTPDDIVFDHLQETAFPSQPLGRPILGTPESVKAISADALKSYQNTSYTAGNMVLAAVGNVDHDALVDMAKAAFAALPAGEGPKHSVAAYSGGEARSDKALEQLHITLGFSGVSLYDDHYYTKQVFSMLFGGGMSSRLFQQVREKRGLAYSVYSFTSSHEDTGLWGIYAGTSGDMAAELIDELASELHDVMENVTDKEVLRARTQLKAGLMMAMESTSTRAEQLGRQMMIFDRVVPVDEVLKGVDAVDVAAVKDFIKQSLSKPITVAYVGPGESVPPYEDVQAKFKL